MPVLYKVWPFRRFSGCYECDATEHIEAIPALEPFELTGEEFIALERSVRERRDSEFTYLYHVIGTDDDRAGTRLRAHITNGLELIEAEKERAETKARREREKQAKAQAEADARKAKAVLDERKQYEELKAKFER